jgi:hypothetical protein
MPAVFVHGNPDSRLFCERVSLLVLRVASYMSERPAKRPRALKRLWST